MKPKHQHNKFYPFSNETTYLIHKYCQLWDHDYESQIRIGSNKFGYHIKPLEGIKRGRNTQYIYFPDYKSPREEWIEKLEAIISAYFTHPDIEANWRQLDIYPKDGCECKGCHFRRQLQKPLEVVTSG